MKIHLNRAGQSLGQFLPDEVRRGFNEGKFFATDLAWRDGMAMWEPLEKVLDTIAPISEETGEVLIEQTPEAAGPPWEQREQLGFLKAFLETIRAVLLEPTATFSRMKLRGGFGAPLVFFLITSMIGAVAMEFYKFAFRSLGGAMLQGEEGQKLLAQMGTNYESLQSILVMPFVFIVGAFLVAGVVHICLMLVGGANRPYEATFRVMAYAGGAAALMNLLPVVGVLVAGVWGLIVEVIGLSSVQGIGKGRAVLALLLPLLLCCGLLLVAVFFVMGGGAAWGPMLGEYLQLKP